MHSGNERHLKRQMTRSGTTAPASRQAQRHQRHHEEEDSATVPRSSMVRCEIPTRPNTSSAPQHGRDDHGADVGASS
jgi:hypothetical protein